MPRKRRSAPVHIVEEEGERIVILREQKKAINAGISKKSLYGKVFSPVFSYALSTMPLR